MKFLLQAIGILLIFLETIRCQEYRLPTNVKPSHYDLNLQINVTTSRFMGRALIDVQVLEDDVHEIKLNHFHLTVATMTFNSGGRGNHNILQTPKIPKTFP